MVGKTWCPHYVYSFYYANYMRNLVKGGSIGPVKHNKIGVKAIIFLYISLNMYFGCSKEPSH